MKPEKELLHGPALAAALKVLDSGPQTGHQVVSRLRTECPEALSQGAAALFALLYYFEGHGLVRASWMDTPHGPRRCYCLTDRGRHRLETEVQHWRSLARLLGRDNAPPAGSELEDRHG